MNIENIDKAIAIMERAKLHEENFNMVRWQSSEFSDQDDISKIIKTEEKLHQCGNTACFAGWVAISPEWKAAGGMIDPIGSPVMYRLGGECAIAHWLGIHTLLAECLVLGGVINFNQLDPMEPIPFVYSANFGNFYNKSFLQVKPQDVIDKLKDIKLNYKD